MRKSVEADPMSSNSSTEKNKKGEAILGIARKIEPLYSDIAIRQDHNGMTACHYAALLGSPPNSKIPSLSLSLSLFSLSLALSLSLSLLISFFFLTGFEVLVEHFTAQLQQGAINVKDINGITILHYAAHSGQFDTVQKLIAKGADPNLKVIMPHLVYLLLIHAVIIRICSTSLLKTMRKLKDLQMLWESSTSLSLKSQKHQVEAPS